MIGIAVVVLTLALALHLVEEVKTGFRKRFPLGEVPLPVFVGLNVLIYAGALLSALLCFAGHPAGLTLAWMYGVAMLVNGVGHIGIMLFRRTYFPGGFTAFVLLPASVWLLVLLARVE
jgi:hypothetical protein